MDKDTDTILKLHPIIDLINTAEIILFTSSKNIKALNLLFVKAKEDKNHIIKYLQEIDDKLLQYFKYTKDESNIILYNTVRDNISKLLPDLKDPILSEDILFKLVEVLTELKLRLSKEFQGTKSKNGRRRHTRTPRYRRSRNYKK